MTAPSLDYFELIKTARKIVRNVEGYPEVRVAILADSSTQHLAQMLRACLHRHRMFAQVHEAGFDVIDQEVFAGDSELYRFKPDYVLLHVCTQALRDRYYREGFQGRRLAEETLARAVDRWDEIGRRTSARIIQNLYVLPVERVFGNFSRTVPDSLNAALADLNARLVEAARRRPNVLIHDVEHLASDAGKRVWSDETLWVHAKVFCRLEFLPEAAESLAGIVLAGAGRGKKCVVLDLDNTLWGGVIGDDGLSGIEVGDHGVGEAYARFQGFLLALKARGLILAVCSKNERENALLPFREHPRMLLREKDISAFVANWESKAENIQGIARTLNIGLDSMVFLDDSPFEREQVRGLLPEVCVPEFPEDPAEIVPFLSRLNIFETVSLSAEDARRTELYQDQARRDQEKARFSSVDEYLKSLSMEAVFARFDPFNLPRVAQLLLRSNQFNLTTRRYNEAECAAFMDDAAGCWPVAVSLKDRFGDYGLIAVIIARLESPVLVLDSWLMSCRVLQRGVEQLCMNRVFAFAKAGGFKTVQGIFAPTPKNGMVRDFYGRFGFRASAPDGEGRVFWTRSVSDYQPSEVFISCP